MKKNMILNESDIRTLAALSENSSLELMAQALGKDQTVISKRLKKISEKADVLIKISGRWCLNETGRRILHLSKDFITAQQAILENKKHIRLGASREFAAKFVAPHAQKIQKISGAHSLTINAYENGVEEALLNGEIDIGFDCGRPKSPEIKFKQCLSESISAVATHDFLRGFSKQKITAEFLMTLPHVFCNRLHPNVIMGPDLDPQNIILSTNDIASARAATLNGTGWALLPTYTIFSELSDKKLILIKDFEYHGEKYGVWMLRSRSHLEKEFQKLQEWLGLVW